MSLAWCLTQNPYENLKVMMINQTFLVLRDWTKARDPGDSDGDDSDNGGGNNGPHRGPQKASSPSNPQRIPFNNLPEESSLTASKPPQEPQFDIKLKVDTIPTWDGHSEDLRWWLLMVNSLSKRCPVVFKQLGMLVPTQLTGSAEIWYYSQSVEVHNKIEQDWNTLRMVIGEYYMNWAFLDKQKAGANHAFYCNTGNVREMPREYIICKIEHL